MIKDFRIYVIRGKLFCALLDYGSDSNGLSPDRIKAAIESLEIPEFNSEAVAKAIKDGKFTSLEISDSTPKSLPGTCWVVRGNETDNVKVSIAPPHGEGEHVTLEKISEEIGKAGFGKFEILSDIIKSKRVPRKIRIHPPRRWNMLRASCSPHW